MTFDDFVAAHGRRLQAGLVAAYGSEVGLDAAAEALAYGWEHWPTVGSVDNPTGYLYRVGQSTAKRSRRPQGHLPTRAAVGLPDFEPMLGPALQSLSESQRVAVVLVHAFGWTLADAAEVLGVSLSTLRTHLSRGMSRLRTSLKVDSNAW